MNRTFINFQGENGMVHLYLDGYDDTFEVSPSIIQNSGQFSISVKNNKKLDFEKVQRLEFLVRMSYNIGWNKEETIELLTFFYHFRQGLCPGAWPQKADRQCTGQRQLDRRQRQFAKVR